MNEILKNIDEIKCVFSFSMYNIYCKNLFFTAVKHIFHIFTGFLPYYILLTFKSINMLWSNHQFLITSELFKMTIWSSRGMKIIIFHLWLSPQVKYLFLYHSLKINPIFIGSPIKWSCCSDIEIFFDWAMSFIQRFDICEKQSDIWVKPVTLNLLG